MTWKLYFDGGARGNGQKNCVSGAGFTLQKPGYEKLEGGTYDRGKTNNEMEYMGAIGGLALFDSLNITNEDLIIMGDSSIVINQLNKSWRCKAENLKPLKKKAEGFLRRIRDRGCKVTLKWIPREQNKEADALSNYYMDQVK